MMTEADTSQNQQPQPSQQPHPVPVDDTRATPLYANFCRVTGTPEEVIVDFGLNASSVHAPAAPLVVSQRIVINYYTAKRLLHTLGLTVHRHEATFGVLETDVQKRAKPAATRQAGA
jgi:hypothetical protein